MTEKLLQMILEMLKAMSGHVGDIAKLLVQPKEKELFTASSGKGQMGNQQFVKSSKGKLFDAWMSNGSLVDLYLGVVDKKCAAVNGDQLLSPVPVAASTAGYLTYPARGRPFQDGIQVVASTTLGTVTLPAGANANLCHFDCVAE